MLHVLSKQDLIETIQEDTDKQLSYLEKLAKYRKLPVEWLINEACFYADTADEIVFLLENIGDVKLEDAGFTDELLKRLEGRYVFPLVDSRDNLIRLVGYDMTGESKMKYLNVAPVDEAGEPMLQSVSYAYLGDWFNFESIIVVEGLFDGIVLKNQNVSNVVCMLRNSPSDTLIHILRRYKTVIVVADEDKSERNQGHNVLRNLTKLGINHIAHYVPYGMKDVDELKKEYTTDFNKWIEQLQKLV